MRTPLLLVLAALVALSAASCAQPQATIQPMRLLEPKRPMILTYRCEVQQAMPQKASQKSVDWTELDLPVRVSAVGKTDKLRAAMRVQAIRQGHDLAEGRKSQPATAPDTAMRITTRYATPMEDDLRDAEFIAVLDRNEKVLSVDAAGAAWMRRKRELAETMRRGASKDEAEIEFRALTPGVFSALEDALAYLPPADATVGMSYAVSRERVLPYNPLGFAEITRGRMSCREESVCRVSVIWPKASCWIAFVDIKGRRVPRGGKQADAKQAGGKIEHFELTGELEVNLTTRSVQRLRIQTVPVSENESEASARKVFVDLVTLRPK